MEYALIGAYALIGSSVVSMAVVMLRRDDPDASVGLTAGLGTFAVLLWVLVGAAYRPLLRPRREPPAAGHRDGDRLRASTLS